jgi:hypothetical protein
VGTGDRIGGMGFVQAERSLRYASAHRKPARWMLTVLGQERIERKCISGNRRVARQDRHP